MRAWQETSESSMQQQEDDEVVVVVHGGRILRQVKANDYGNHDPTPATGTKGSFVICFPTFSTFLCKSHIF